MICWLIGHNYRNTDFTQTSHTTGGGTTTSASATTALICLRCGKRKAVHAEKI